MLEFRTLGTIDLRRKSGGRIESVLGHSKRLSLLAYLCASYPAGLHRRDSLVALLWPELEDAHARGALRHELYELRRSLGSGALRGDGDESVGVDGQRLWCDVTAFDAAVDAGRLEEAMDLWRGDFLPGLHVNGGEFEHWLDGARDRLVRRVVEAGRRLSTRADKAGDSARALSWAQRLTELAPYDETGWQRMIQLLDRSGDRAGALMAYQDLTTRLREELEVEPSPETRALIEGIRQRAKVFAVPIGSSNAAEPPAPHRESGSAPEVVREAPNALQPPDADLRANTDAVRDSKGLVWRRLRSAAFALPAVAALAVLITAWTVTHAPKHQRTVIEAPQVENQTGDTTLEVVRRRVADRLTEELVGIEFVEVIAPGRRERVDALISATLYQRGTMLVVYTRLQQPGAGGQVLATPEPVLVPLPPDNPDPALDEVIGRVLEAVHAHYDKRFEGAGGRLPIKPPPWEAYTEYVRGADLFGEKQYREAATHLLASNRLGYGKAGVFGAIALAYGGRPAAADSVASTLLANDSTLGDYERYFASWFLADLYGRRTAAYQAAQEFERAGAGGSPSAITVAAVEAMRLNRPHEAVRKFERVDVGHGWLRHYGQLWEWWAGAHHMRGEHRDELGVAGAGRTRFPGSLEMIRTEIRGRAALRQFDRVTQLIDESLTMPAEGSSPAEVAWVAAQELDAHGQPKEAAAARRMALQWLSNRRTPTAGETMFHVRVLLESGDADSAQRLLATLPSQKGLDWLGLTGLVAAARGDTAAAHAAIAGLDSLRKPYLNGRHLLLVSGIRATLGQPQLAMETLRRALAEGQPFGVELHALPMLHSLAERRDFKALLRPRG